KNSVGRQEAAYRNGRPWRASGNGRSPRGGKTARYRGHCGAYSGSLSAARGSEEGPSARDPALHVLTGDLEDAYTRDGRRFSVLSDEKHSAFLELERVRGVALGRETVMSRLFEIAIVMVRFDHTSMSLVDKPEMLSSAKQLWRTVADLVRLVQSEQLSRLL